MSCLYKSSLLDQEYWANSKNELTPEAIQLRQKILGSPPTFAEACQNICKSAAESAIELERVFIEELDKANFCVDASPTVSQTVLVTVTTNILEHFAYTRELLGWSFTIGQKVYYRGGSDIQGKCVSSSVAIYSREDGGALSLRSGAMLVFMYQRHEKKFEWDILPKTKELTNVPGAMMYSYHSQHENIDQVNIGLVIPSATPDQLAPENTAFPTCIDSKSGRFAGWTIKVSNGSDEWVVHGPDDKVYATGRLAKNHHGAWAKPRLFVLGDVMICTQRYLAKGYGGTTEHFGRAVLFVLPPSGSLTKAARVSCN